MHSCNTVTNWQQHYSPVLIRCSVNVYRPRIYSSKRNSTAYRVHFLYVQYFVYANAYAHVLCIPLKWQEISPKVFYHFGGWICWCLCHAAPTEHLLPCKHVSRSNPLLHTFCTSSRRALWTSTFYFFFFLFSMLSSHVELNSAQIFLNLKYPPSIYFNG